ncbi:MAG TPA: hypothetical protein VGI99_07215, partial [Gemmataceae bacterium]
MLTVEQFLVVLGAVVIAAPTVLVLVLGITTLLDARLSEESTARASRLAVGAGLLACCGVLGLMIATGTRHVVLDLGNWVELHGESGYRPHFAVKFEFDRLSVPLAMLSFILCGVIASFAAKYMHREPGYNRFFTLFAVFLAGMVIASLADTIETLFTGWELVGLSSALLIAFFQERPAPCRNGFRVWVVYRISDAAL